MKKTLLTFLILLVSIIPAGTYAQLPKSTVSGVVTDEASLQPVFSASVVLQGTDPLLGAITDEKGYFEIRNLPVGRYDVQVTFVGYEPVVVKEIIVSSARGARVDVKMREQVTSLGEVVVKPKVSKEEPLNRMATVSARMLSVEEASRYAGGADDPARLATSFAGVSGSIAGNGIVVRGNAPKSLQWKMEGIEIPNPNHFADISAFGGGGLTALSSQMLANSDFFTGAFPAEYSNALSGVFDIFMRTGSSTDHLHTLQAGIIGLDVSSEGPLYRTSGTVNPSYLFNYRYSTLALVTPLLPEDAQGTAYQDLSFKLNFPAKRAGTFSVWGIGLIDKSGAIAETDSTLWFYLQDKEEMDAKQYMGAGGVNHSYYTRNNLNIRTSLAATVTGLDYNTQRMDAMLQLRPQSLVQNTNTNLVFTSSVAKKINASHTHKSGVTITGLMYDMLLYDAAGTGLPPQVIVDKQGSSALVSAYSGSAFRLKENISLNLGITGQLFTLNNHYVIEPRAGIRWQFTNMQYLGFAYGHHSRLEKLNYYFTATNKDLDFAKAHHLVLSYGINLTANSLLKAEAYYQMLYDVPVNKGGTFSFINLTDEWFYNQPLVNNGKGRNYGIDLTLERYLSGNYYYMITSSLFNSLYTGDDGVWRNTKYNLNFIVNALGGREWYMGRNDRNVLGVNLRATLQGGERYTLPDVQASLARKTIIDDETRPFTAQLDPALMVHFTISYRMNREKVSHEIALKMLNVTNYKDFYGYRYNFKAHSLDKNFEAIMIPNLSYKVEFQVGERRGHRGR